MNKALDINDNEVDAYEASYDETYRCPVCKEEVFLVYRNGGITRFFSHFPGASHIGASGDMSEWHKGWQDYFSLTQRECRFQDGYTLNIADVCLFNYRICEFQNSSIKKKEFDHRNIFYQTFGGGIFWLFNEIGNYNKKKIYHKEYTTYRWDNIHSYLLDFDFKNPKIRLFIQIKDDRIVEIKRINKREIEAGKQMTKESFLRLLYDDIPSALKLSKGILGDILFKFRDNSISYCYNCPMNEGNVEFEKCCNCKCHLIHEVNGDYCFYRFKDIDTTNVKEIIPKYYYNVVNSYEIKKEGTCECVECQRTNLQRYRTIRQLYLDYGKIPVLDCYNKLTGEKWRIVAKDIYGKDFIYGKRDFKGKKVKIDDFDKKIWKLYKEAN